VKSYILLAFLVVAACFRAHAQPNEDLSGGTVWESEPYLATDPANPQHMVVAWMGNVPLSRLCIKTITTFNGGLSWTSPAIIPHVSPTYTSADVSMAFDHSGNLYATYIDSRQSPDSGAVYIARSTDGGLTWGPPAMVISGFADGTKFPMDRPWLSISRTTGPVPDTLYVTTKPAPWVAPPNRPYFVRSFDGGATWSAWRYIDSAGYLVGSVIQAPMAAPAIDSSGRFHCIYPTYVPSVSVYPRYIMATAGPSASFSYNTALTVVGGGAIDTLAKAGGRFTCDPTNNRHFAFAHVENQYGDLDIFSLETSDGGATWSPVQRVNDDPAGNGKMQDMVWAGYDEHGNLVAAWRDRRNAPGSGYQQPSEIWGAIKWHDSAAFSANFRISDTAAPYDSAYLSINGNDFMNVAMAQDTLSAVWGDVRTGVLNIWFARRDMHTGLTTILRNIVSEPLPGVNLYPNPANHSVTITGPGMSRISIIDPSGNTVLEKILVSDSQQLDVSVLPPGIYTALVHTRSGTQSIKVTIRH